MINTELIAKAICQQGKCKTCDEDCIDYKAAQRVMNVLIREAVEKEFAREVSKDGSNA